MNAADIIASRLHAAGVRHAFGIPGGEVLTLIDALERAGIRFELARHENAAGFMAEGAWHATGAPGVLVATVGPGVANAFNVVANAEQDRVPLIVISGMVDPAVAMSYTHQVFDHGAVFRQVCKASFTAADGAIDVMIEKAIRIAQSGRPGPVHIDLPIRVAGAAQPAPREAMPAAVAPSAPAGGPALDRARAMLAAARRPVILAGLDVLNEAGGPEALRGFAEAQGIPVVTTYKAKGVLPEDHPLCLGGHGLSPKSDAILLPLFEAADLVILAGYDPIEMRVGWRDPWEPGKAIEFAHAPNTHDMHRAGLSWLCSVAGGLAALGPAGTDLWACGTPGRVRAELIEAFRPRGSWGPDHAMAEMLAVLPADAVASVDSGAHRILLSQHFFARRPRALIQSTGLCTMGCALPLALGHRIADPGRPAVAFMGDGCAEMVLGELATLRDSGAPVVVVVFVDRSLALIELKQRKEGLQNAGVDFGRTDFAGLARLFGGIGVTVRGPGEAGPALEDALAADRFTVIEVEIPRRAYDGLI
ncbi:thiamine pyrophosphate-binding protein [Limibaculum sp. M0105]|uniref:Thiamine pyrophosphate-binding protein n=1 Tax=Thermohalobaculum xanthum TaxID=2753746 RepID=A0A8J7SET3_9RHOB|nr:thiamine pyrophosphate-binding protein [Thermohalobaculum xanthum]MBK0400018.1 thiamine pyrophosphate-binding protein [Thermohalobaculum xanthum]